MDADFWLQKWKKNEIGFHEPQSNALLVKHFGRLALCKGSRVFLPLCGKTHDIGWLLSNGLRVAGAELSEVAIDQLFIDLGVKPAVSGAGEMTHYCAENVDIFAGDIFNLSRETLGPVDAVYDRAALVALPEDVRNRYANHVAAIAGHVSQLLITFEYDQSQMQGPPFSISSRAVRQYYQESYDLTLIESANVAGGLKGICKAKENIWLLERKKPE